MMFGAIFSEAYHLITGGCELCSTMNLKRLILNIILYHKAYGFWEMGTTTLSDNPNDDERPRQSFFRWQITQFDILEFWTPGWDWLDLKYRRRLAVVCGYSIHFTNLGVGALLNRRTTITSANFLEPFQDVPYDIRIWALGRGGSYRTPYRYRVWRARRLVPRSNNPEHWHGPRGRHVPRHDVTIVHSLDQIYLFPYLSDRYHYATRAFLYGKYWKLPEVMFFAGSCYEDALHIKENYKIYYTALRIRGKAAIIDCSMYLPKWWGKFICFRNPADSYTRVACVPNGGPLLDWDLYIIGIGCFEIRYNEERILVFTDLRYYIDHIHIFANITPGLYYEYAYQSWGNPIGWFFDGNENSPFIPMLNRMYDLYPMGK